MSETLQKDDLDIISACKIAETTLNALKNLRISAKGFNDAYDESVKIATANSIPTPEATETDKKRKRRRTQDNTDDDLNNQRYQLIFNSILDAFIEEIDKKFDKSSMGPIQCIYNIIMSDCKPVYCIAEELAIYNDIVNFAELDTELNLWYQYKKDHLQADASKQTQFRDIAEFFVQSNLTTSFKCIFKLMKIYLSIPVSSAEAERSFSTLKRIKTWLRTSMQQNRLTSLAVLNIERVQAAKIDLELVIDKFSEVKNRRIKFF